MDIAVVLATVAFVLVVLLVIVYLSIRVVQQYERMVVFRLGRTDQAMVRNPGLNFLNASNWTALPGDVPGISNTASKMDTLTTSNRFYRVRVLP